MALAGSTAAFAAVPTTLSANYNASTGFFHGAVHSSNAECEAGRAVKIYLQKAGADSLQGKTMSKANGTWKIEVMHAGGHYYAVAPSGPRRCPRAAPCVRSLPPVRTSQHRGSIMGS